MRTARRVIVCLLVLVEGGLLQAQQPAPPAQGSVDTDMTITGSDEAVIPVPEPPHPGDDPVLPPLDTDPPPSFIVPPVVPPPGSMLPATGTIPPSADARAAIPAGPDSR
jgi:hypothetical protein